MVILPFGRVRSPCGPSRPQFGFMLVSSARREETKAKLDFSELSDAISLLGRKKTLVVTSRPTTFYAACDRLLTSDTGTLECEELPGRA